MTRLGKLAAAAAAATILHTTPAACPPPTGALQSQGLSEMDVRTLFSMTAAKRLAWYKQQLSSYQSQLQASSNCHQIPMQLLATVILNELGDINWQDVWQQRLANSGSLGFAQIQVGTAKSHKLVEQAGDKLPLSDSQVAKRLAIPEYAIEAAAREVRLLVESMTKNLSNPWQQRFSFSLTSINHLKSANDIYNFIGGATQREKEQNLAELVIAAYNSPGIIEAKKAASITPNVPGFIYANGTIHGGNSRHIAAELFDNHLFH
jgi:hypothetical protein